MEGNRIAEYLYDESLGISSLIREYIWATGRIVAVFENNTLYFVRTDHIGRPVFATDGGGAKVWEASYLPFGGVAASSGLNPDLRFPGQWFHASSGLHQNWMRDELAVSQPEIARLWSVDERTVKREIGL